MRGSNEIIILLIGLTVGGVLGFALCANIVSPELNKLRASNKTLLELVEKRMK